MVNSNGRMSFTSLMIALSLVLTVSGSALQKKSTLSRRAPQSSITQSHTGEGTMWGGNWKGGNCLFAYWDQPTQYPEIAMGGDNWNDGLLCGACIEVQSGSNPPVIGLVGDKCPSCTREGIDLDPEMWRRVTRGAKAGKITVTWKVVPCQYDQLPFLLIKKEGTSEHYFALQVAQSGQPILSLEYRPSGTGNWVKTKRDTNMNYFVNAGGQRAGARADIKVCCGDGVTIIITENVDLSGPGVIRAKSNCPPSLQGGTATSTKSLP